MTSSELFAQAKARIPGGVNSPVRSFKHVGGDPIYFSHGKGAQLFDVEGKSYIDFCLSFGPQILGHSHPAVVDALKSQAEKATSFGACHPGEVELAGLILKGYPALDKVRLVNSGTEAVMTAARIARGFTERPKILMFEGCYHGHSDAFLAKSGSGVAALSEAASKGVPPPIVAETLVARLDRPDEVRAIFARYGREIAAVVFELIPANYGLYVPYGTWIREIFDLAKQNGALVIADEVITGFRVGLTGACGHFGVEPDLVTLGKIIGGGLPLAAVAGRAEIMDVLAPVGSVYQAGTLSGNPLAVAAGIAVLKELNASAPYAALADRTASFVAELAPRLPKPASVVHLGSMFWIFLGEHLDTFPPSFPKDSTTRFASLFRSALERGVYLPPSPYEVCFLSTAHSESVLQTALEGICQK